MSDEPRHVLEARLARRDVHTAHNKLMGLEEGAKLALFCPRCATPHREMLTNDPGEADYLHHVHQCTACGLRFDVFVRCRGIL